MCNIVSLVISLISVKHLVEEQCFSKPSSTLETCSIPIFTQQFLVDCTHYQYSCLSLNKPMIRCKQVSVSDHYTEEIKMDGSIIGHSLRSPFLYLL